VSPIFLYDWFAAQEIKIEVGVSYFYFAFQIFWRSHDRLIVTVWLYGGISMMVGLDRKQCIIKLTTFDWTDNGQGCGFIEEKKRRRSQNPS
jgi:hypothetical protein